MMANINLLLLHKTCVLRGKVLFALLYLVSSRLTKLIQLILDL